MGSVDTERSSRRQAVGDSKVTRREEARPILSRVALFAGIATIFFIAASQLPTRSQSGRQKGPAPSPTANNNSRPRQASRLPPPPPLRKPAAAQSNANDNS